MRVAYFTAGTVGAGHLTRGLALGHGLARQGFRGEYQMFGPPVPYPVGQRADYTPVTIAPAEARDPRLAVAGEVAQALTAFRPDLLIVDLFWASVRHLLESVGCEAWLLVRKCPGQWFVGPPDTQFDPDQFRRTIAIEPFRHVMLDERVDPIVIRNPDECRPPQALRERLGVPPGNTLTVVTHAGLAGEIEQMATNADETSVRCDLHQEDALFPLAEWLPGADRIHSGAGYNSYWEARWLGYEPRTHFTPLPRRIDDQAWRIETCRGHVMRSNGADVLAADILRG